MNDSTDDGLLEELVAQCLDRAERDGESAIDEVCSEHPDLADAIRERIELLESSGLWTLPVPEEIPEQLGEFDLIRRLGEGGMGVVYLAEQSSLDRLVALKVVRPTQLYFPGTRERFQREVSIVARLQHPNIVPIFTVGEASGLPYFAMEYIEGCTLGDVLEEVSDVPSSQLTGEHMSRIIGTLSPLDSSNRRASWRSGSKTMRASDSQRDRRKESAVREREERAPSAAISQVDASSWIDACLRVATQIADALHHAHERGIIHRDIKPSNVLLTADGTARLTDFGLAKVDDPLQLSRTGQMIGTPYYMSPEQVDHEGSEAELDERSDVYSLGVVLFEMLTLTRPFPGDSAAVVFDQILTRAPIAPRTANSQLDRDLEAVCLRALAKRPADRYESAAAFADDLRRRLRGEPTRARPQSLIIRGLRSIQTLSPTVLQFLVLAVVAGWWTLDALVLTPAADIDIAGHGARRVALAVAAGLLAWVASALAQRTLAPRRYGWMAGVAVALILGAVAVSDVNDSEVAQRYTIAKARLADDIEFQLRVLRSTSPEQLDAFADEYNEILNESDLALLVAALANNKRLDKARVYADRIAEMTLDAPAVHAFRYTASLDDGRLGDAAVHEAALWNSGETDPARWLQAADILSAYGHTLLARRALGRGSVGTDNRLRDRFNVRLIANSLKMCLFDEAEDLLNSYLRFGPPSPDILTLQLRLVTRTHSPDQPLDDIFALVERIETSDWATPSVIAWARLYVISKVPNVDADWLFEVLDDHPNDLTVLRRIVLYALQVHHPERRKLAARMLELSKTVAARGDYYAGVALVGLGSIAQYEKRYDEALEFVRRAAEHDPRLPEPYVAEANILILAARERSDVLDLETVRACTDLFRKSVEASGRNPQTLNNAAYALLLLHGYTGDPNLIAEAEHTLNRAHFLLRHAAVGECPDVREDKRVGANAWATQSSLREAVGDLDGALSAAEESWEIAREFKLTELEAAAERRIAELERAIAAR